MPDQLRGVAGEQATGVKEPSKTVLVGEAPAWSCYSWHQPRKVVAAESGDFWFNNARCVTSFVDEGVK